MSPDSHSYFNENDVKTLFNALGGSIDRVLQTTNSVKIRGLGVFRKGVDGISFEASEDLESYVNVDFEGLDIVSYDPSDLARSHLKREEFSFEEDPISKSATQTEIVTPVVLSADRINTDDLEVEDVVSDTVEDAELEVIEESIDSVVEDPNPFDIEHESIIADIETEEKLDVEDFQEVLPDDEGLSIDEVSDEKMEPAGSISEDYLGNLKVDEELNGLDDRQEDEKWLPKDDPAWMDVDEQTSKPFVLPIKKSEREFAEKDDQEIRERREIAKLHRRRQKKRRMWISILGLLFAVAALSLFWWLINSGTIKNPLNSESQSAIENASRAPVALDDEVIEPAAEDSLYLDIPVIDYSDPNSVSDLARGKFTWILYSSNERRDALARSKFYRDSGYENDVIKVSLKGLDTYRVSFGRFSGFREATEADSTLPNGIQGTWVDKLEDSFNLSQNVK